MSDFLKSAPPLATLEATAAAYGTPFHLYSEAGIRAAARTLHGGFRRHFPDFIEYFAVKATPNPHILRLLLEEGCGLDCSSVVELQLAAAAGAPPDRIMYTSNYTSRADLARAVDMGVVLNLDDGSLVEGVVAARGACPALVSFRLNPGVGNTSSETASNVLGGPRAKFGVPRDGIVAAYAAARAAGATRFGMHMMTGSNVRDVAYWESTVTILLDTMAEVSRVLGISFEFVNIGGGLGIPYREGEPPVDVAELAARLRAVFDSRLAAHGIAVPPRLCMENGRYLTGPSGWLVARCQAVKQTTEARYVGLDACMADLMRPGMYGAHHHIGVPARERDATGASAPRILQNVVGSLCENNDWFCAARPLPRVNVGDLVVVHDTGAHGHAMGFQYNGKLRSPEVLLRVDGGTTLIRQRETYENYVACVVPLSRAAAVVATASGRVVAAATLAAFVVAAIIARALRGR